MNDFFPTVCVDNFFEDPNTIRKLADFFEYKPSEDGKWPGVRTENLHKLSNEFFNQFLSKFFRIFYNYDHEQLNWNASVYFQKTKPYGEDRELNCGWIHCDDDCVVAGLIYLDEDNDSNAGTSIFSCLDVDLYNNSKDKIELKRKLYLGEDIDIDDYKKIYNEFENNFVKTLQFKNVFNRMIAYDGNTYHRADSFNGSKNEERLTLVFFVHEIESKTVPLMRNLDTYNF